MLSEVLKTLFNPNLSGKSRLSRIIREYFSGKKIAVLFVFLLISSSLLAVYSVGDIVADFSWTDNTSATHSIYELIDAEKAVVFFWGGYS